MTDERSEDLVYDTKYIGVEMPVALVCRFQRLKLRRAEAGERVTQGSLLVEAVEELLRLNDL